MSWPINKKFYMKWDGHRSSQLTNVASYICEECYTMFNSQEELIQHENYAKYRRPGYCWQ
jgi:hypothetical protein